MQQLQIAAVRRMQRVQILEILESFQMLGIKKKKKEKRKEKGKEKATWNSNIKLCHKYSFFQSHLQH